MFDPSTYEAVVTRFARFREQFPDYRWYSWISREFTNDKQWVVIGELYRTEADQKPFVTGLGFEPARDEYSLAKAETSALGRCLYAAGFAAKPLGSVDVEKPRQVLRAVPPVSEEVQEKPVANKPEPVQWDVAEIAQALNAEVIATDEVCFHGAMILKQGMGKTGKPYHGYICIEKNKANQCPPRWYKQDPTNGKWTPPLTRADVE
jgi:hypothetical protein